MYLLGIDLGSSSVKVALYDTHRHEQIGMVQYPESEMDIASVHAGWAEQNPDDWWKFTTIAVNQLLDNHKVDASKISGIGIAYQMHGLVIVDRHKKVLRPAIIWCDSRAIKTGEDALKNLGSELCFNKYLNSPGNFTASKLHWVLKNEPHLAGKIHKFMLPGNYLAMRMTETINITVSGLSEAVLWDFQGNQPAYELLDYYKIKPEWIPAITDAFAVQGVLTEKASNALKLPQGIPISYMSGDQPNNAMSLGALNPGDIAASGGTSGVVYAISETLIADNQSRVNSFAHVNHSDKFPRIGILLCINGCGIQYAWMKKHLAEAEKKYADIEDEISRIPIGSEGLINLPFGNGAERMLNNAHPGAQFVGLNFNRHTKEHLFNAALEGIAFSFVYGCELLQELGVSTKVIKVGNDNLFRSRKFSSTIAKTLGAEIHVIETSGALGAAKAAGLALGIFNHPEEVFQNLRTTYIHHPVDDCSGYKLAFENWKVELNKILTQKT